MSKTEILEAISYNEEKITKIKSDIKKLEKAHTLLTEVGVNTDRVDAAENDLREMLKMHIEYLAKRKKALKLLAKLEELEQE